MQQLGRVCWGNAQQDSAVNRGWLIADKQEGLLYAARAQVKYGVHEAGERRTREQATADGERESIMFTIKGRVKFGFLPSAAHPHEHEVEIGPGGFIRWSTDVLHYWEILEDGLFITFRWMREV